MGCSRGVPGLFRGVPGCSGGVPGMFRGVPGVFRGVPGCSGVFRVLQTPDIQYFSVLINGQLSKGCRFDALRNLRDTRLALFCLICKVSDVSVNHLRS